MSWSKKGNWNKKKASLKGKSTVQKNKIRRRKARRTGLLDTLMWYNASTGNRGCDKQVLIPPRKMASLRAGRRVWNKLWSML